MPTLSNRQIWRIVFAAAAILLITSGIRLSLGLTWLVTVPPTASLVGKLF